MIVEVLIVRCHRTGYEVDVTSNERIDDLPHWQDHASQLYKTLAQFKATALHIGVMRPVIE
jgi:DNA-binding PadR family transcriptional regulator